MAQFNEEKCFQNKPGRKFCNMLRIRTITSPVKPAMKPLRVQAFIVCGRVKPENLFTTQKAESFGMDKPTAPQQIAKPTSIGDAPTALIDGATIADVVTNATVDEP